MKKYIPHCLITFSFAAFLVWLSCGKSPSLFPLPLTGYIKITAADLTKADSFFVNLDDVELGEQPNPYLISDIYIGFHKLFIYTAATAGSTKTVEVLQDDTTFVSFWLQSEGPYVGNTAPNFAVVDIQGNPITLEGLQGKVVLLIFFEYT